MDMLKDTFVSVLAIILFIGLGLLAAYYIDKKSCFSAYDNYKPTYSFWGGCRIEWNGKTTPTDIVREISK